MKKKIKVTYLIIIGAIVFSLLILHTFSLLNIIVDTTSILLLIMLIILPFVPNLKKIKWGEFEAEILNETEEELSIIDTSTKLTKNYLERIRRHPVTPEIPGPEERLTVSVLQKQINSLITQLAGLQKQLSEVEVTTPSEKERAENYRTQINTLLVQLAELQRQLNELQNT